MTSIYTNPLIEVAKRNREEVNFIVNAKYFLRIPTEEDRWTEEEIQNRTNSINTERKWCRFGCQCDRLQCSYKHTSEREVICKDFRWCEDPECKLIHPTQKFIDYIDYTPREILLEQGFFWNNTLE
tara:strand:+ start:873 stop:1250 length:378 start_codon:yes stop_codon:yes gene_type:complete